MTWGLLMVLFACIRINFWILVILHWCLSSNQLSSWQIRNDVMELKKKQDADCLKAQSLPVINTNVIT